MDNHIRFKFEAKKAAEAANTILRLSGGRRNYMELVCLLYLADRKALLRFGYPITGDYFAALPHGLILSRILKLVRNGPGDQEDAPWYEVVSGPIGYEVESLKDVENEELSGAEEKVIQEIFAECGRFDWKQLSRFTRSLPEWTNPNGGLLPVPPERVLTLEGKSLEVIASLRKELAVFEHLDRELEEIGPGFAIEETPGWTGRTERL